MILWITLLALGQDCGQGLYPRLSAQTIKSVRLGMTRAEVTKVLGEPMSETAHHTGLSTLEYTREFWKEYQWYPRLWVEVRRNRVERVFARRYTQGGVSHKTLYELGPEGRRGGGRSLARSFGCSPKPFEKSNN